MKSQTLKSLEELAASRRINYGKNGLRDQDPAPRFGGSREELVSRDNLQGDSEAVRVQIKSVLMTRIVVECIREILAEDDSEGSSE